MAKYGMSQVSDLSGGSGSAQLLTFHADFLEEHPGGAGVIFKYAGGDATEAYNEIHEEELVTETLPSEKCLGDVVGTANDAPQTPPPSPDSLTAAATTQDGVPPLTTVVSLDDFEKIAWQYLTPSGKAYYQSGSDDEFSIADSRRIFRKMTLRPRILRAVEPIATETTIIGYPSSLPVYFSPTGQGRYAHKDAERIISSVAGQEGLIYCMPTGSPHEAIFNARHKKDQPLFFQLYCYRDRQIATELLRKVERMGASAIFLTVDTPVISKRERDDRLKAADGDDTIGANAGGVAKIQSRSMLNPLLTWDDLDWIRGATGLPLVLKGVQAVEDAVEAYARGVDGIVLSNHGGRSQDTAQAPILTLLEIRRYAPHLITATRNGKFQILVDGGIRRGTDVIKALALGASAVGIGRPVLYSMCAGYGERGLKRLVQILRAEIETNMALSGARNVSELTSEMVNSSRAEMEVTGRVSL